MIKGIKRYYTFTNEGLRFYMPKFPMEGRDVLTVAASGDHVLGCALAGAKNITAFDHNKYALYWAELKVACAKNLSYDQFLEFYFRNEYAPIKKDEYERVRDALAPETAQYFDKFVKEKVGKTQYCCEEYCPDLGYNEWVAIDKYRDMQKKLGETNIEYIEKDVFDLPKLRHEHAAIFLSNIRDRCFQPERFDDMVTNELPQIMTADGRAAVNYRFFSAATFVPETLEHTGLVCRAHDFNVNRDEVHSVIEVAREGGK